MSSRALFPVLLSCFLVFSVARAHGEGGEVAGFVEEFFPAPAREAIDRYQGEMVVHIPLWTGMSSEVRGKGFFIHKDGWIISAAHIFTRVPRDVLSEGSHITFRGEKAELQSLDSASDIAILKTETGVQNFQDIAIAQELSEGTPVFILVQGAHRSGSSILNFHNGLFATGKIAGYADVLSFVPPFHVMRVAEFLYVIHALTRGFSGGMYVNAKGEFVGMAVFIDGGFTAAVSAATIQNYFTHFLETKKAVQAAQGK